MQNNYTTETKPNIISLSSAARMIGVTTRTLNRMIESGLLRAINAKKQKFVFYEEAVKVAEERKKYLSTNEAAAILDISIPYLYVLAKTGQITRVRCPYTGKYLYPEDSIKNYLLVRPKRRLSQLHLLSDDICDVSTESSKS